MPEKTEYSTLSSSTTGPTPVVRASLAPAQPSKQYNWVIEYDQLELISEIGSGAFGKVLMGPIILD